ncbi:MAG: hypothetical protein H6740_14320 [Alphaproteobacteria bacterium]|nr:hypothetical protein [Alphaproteobacteria bacterium]
MTPQTFKMALRSTARVAAAAALVGCVPKTVTPDDSSAAVDDSASSADDTQVSADDSSATDDSAAADDSASTDDSASSDDSASADDSADPLAECLDTVAAVFGEGGTGSPNDATAECCQEIAEYWDSVNLEGMDANWATRFECCELLQWQGSLACTPWGPPCPPAMSSDEVA